MSEIRIPCFSLLFCLFSAVSPFAQTGQFECPPGTEFKKTESSIKKGGVAVGTEEWCEKGDTNGNPIKHGKWLIRYANGQKMAETEYKDGQMNGLSTQWLPTGQKSSEGFIKNGKRDGKWTGWHLNGRVASEEEYIDGNLRRTTSWTEDGRMFLHPIEYPDPNDKVAKVKQSLRGLWYFLSWNFVTLVVCLLLAVAYWQLFRRAKKWDNTHKIGARTGISGSIIAVTAVIFTMVQSGGGHHGLGFFFLPILVPIVGAVGFAVGWALSIPIMFYIERKESKAVEKVHSIGRPQIIMAVCILAVVSALSIRVFYPPYLAKKAEMATQPEQIRTIYGNWWVKIFPHFNSTAAVFRSIAGNKQTPVEILRDIAAHHAPGYVEVSLATNTNTPPDVLTQLSSNKYNFVRERVASNANTPTEVLINLSKDNAWEVVAQVANNPHTPPEIAVETLNRLSEHAHYPLNARAKKKLREQGIVPRNKPAERIEKSR
ncbi:MAG TPA: hypothetical protein VI895_05470 [Bdellovibrionota bacterium]|nr:hypothetical protein [Bdellovibrionota bacterium]